MPEFFSLFSFEQARTMLSTDSVTTENINISLNTIIDGIESCTKPFFFFFFFCFFFFFVFFFFRGNVENRVHTAILMKIISRGLMIIVE